MQDFSNGTVEESAGRWNSPSGSRLIEHATGTPEPQTPGPLSQPTAEYAPTVVSIAYSLRNPVDSFEFVVPSDAYPCRVPHAYTTTSSPDAARCWVPCLDSLWVKCAWEFEFVMPRYLEERTPTDDDDEMPDCIPTMVICSGDLVGQSQLATSTTFLRSATSFYTTEFGSYPFSSFKLVFVEEIPTQRFDSATLSLVTSDFLHGEDAIDQALESRQALACQWSGINIIPKT
ncbi:hypothetical protein NMY22_g9419 [Coprinellus aureogranulatus]|nr:hypothetical protein NMY22_g9419 [Coprinellus aureogranulatus]